MFDRPANSLLPIRMKCTGGNPLTCTYHAEVSGFFPYNGKEERFLHKDLDLAADYDSRIDLVGLNGCDG